MTDRTPVHIPLFRATLLGVLLVTTALALLAAPWDVWVAQADPYVLAPIRDTLAAVEQAAGR